MEGLEACEGGELGWRGEELGGDGVWVRWLVRGGGGESLMGGLEEGFPGVTLGLEARMWVSASWLAGHSVTTRDHTGLSSAPIRLSG